jgi:hypothetical protein
MQPEYKIGRGRPPRYSRFKPGQSGNPSGRPKSAGLRMVEWLNQFASGNFTERQLRAIVTDWQSPWAKRSAALRALRTLEISDLADFQELIDGSLDLAGLKAKGVDTSSIKRFKRRTRTAPREDGTLETIVETEIELHDRSGAEFDRLMDRTLGRPKQGVDVTSNGESIYKAVSGVSLDDT